MKYTFSAVWSDQLKQAILNECKEPFNCCFNQTDANIITLAVNQGIDSYLETCFVPERRDSYRNVNNKLYCTISSKSLVCLVRRLLEIAYNDKYQNDIQNRAYDIASNICYELNIELI